MNKNINSYSFGSKKFSGLKTVEDSINFLLKPIATKNSKKYSLINSLAKNWQDIIGTKYANYCQPKSINFAKDGSIKLNIIVFNSAAGFFLKNNSDIFIERIAGFYGYKAISKIYIKQEARLVKKSSENTRELSLDQKNLVNKNIKNISDKNLQETLKKLATVIFNENDSKH